MTEDVLTMPRDCVEAGHEVEERDPLSNEIFGEPADPPTSCDPKPAQNSNQDRGLLNRAPREREATQNLAVHLKDQVTERESSTSTIERQLSAYRAVAESWQEQIDEVIREGDETKNFETACLVRKAVSTVTNIHKEAYEVITNPSSKYVTLWFYAA
jgi:hypothetical protein